MIALEDIERAREAIAGVAVQTPLVRLNVDAEQQIYLKLETLQPVNSFKIRGAGNAVLSSSDDELKGGVLTASAGNMAQGVALAARLRGVPATIVVPEHAPEAKLAAIARLGGRVIKVPYERWWQTLVDGGFPGESGMFVHPVADPRVMAGNGTIGLELLEQLDDFDAVVVPYGGGGLFTGIASAVKAHRPDVKVYAVEPATAAPVTATLAAGGTPTSVEYVPSFVDGSGRARVDPVRLGARVGTDRRCIRNPDRRGGGGGAAPGRACTRRRRGGGCARERRRGLGQSPRCVERSSASFPAATSTSRC